MRQLKIALDYDGTYTEDRELWKSFLTLAREIGHDVRIVTFRGIYDRNSELKYELPKIRRVPVICTGRIPKKEYCESIGWMPDIWIDDNPELITQPSDWSDEEYKKWRQHEGLSNRESEK